MGECAVFLSRLEFSVLLIAEGIEEISCFVLPESKDVNEKQMINAIYSLVQKGFIQVEEHGLKLSAEMEEMMESVKSATGYLLVESSRDEQPQRIIYLGKHAVILENTADANQDFRMFSKEQEEFWEWIEENMEVPAFEVPSRAEAEELLSMNELMLYEFRVLKECSYPGIVPGIRLWMEKIRESLGELPCMGVRFISDLDKEVKWDVILCWGCANLWFLWCEPDKDILSGKESFVEIAPDAVETRKEIQELFWREVK